MITYKVANRFTQIDIPEMKPEDIPLGNPKYLEVIGKDAYEYVTAIPYPTLGNNEDGKKIPYLRGFFKSFKAWCGQCAIPGSSNLMDGGHDYPSVDLYSVGCTLEDDSAVEDENERSGICYIRVAVPGINMAGNSNEGLIKAIKLKSVEMSIMTNAAEVRIINGNECVVGILESPRNDIVVKGAMPQKTFANKQTQYDEKEILALIESGYIDFETDSEELVIKGQVSRKAALRMQFEGADKPLAVKVMNAIKAKSKQISNKENKKMTDEEKKAIAAESAAQVINILDERKKKEEIENAQKTKNALSDDQAKQIRELLRDGGIEFSDDDDLVEVFEFWKKREVETAATEAENRAAEDAGGKTVKNKDGSEVANPLYGIYLQGYKGLGVKVKNKEHIKAKRRELSDDAGIKVLKEQWLNNTATGSGKGKYFTEAV